MGNTESTSSESYHMQCSTDQVTSLTWPKDNSQLFDFDASSYDKIVWTLKEGGFINKNGLIVSFMKQHTACTIAEISEKQGKFMLKSTEDLWQVIKQRKSSSTPIGFPLDIGTNFKMGRVRFAVIETSMSISKEKSAPPSLHSSLVNCKSVDNMSSHPPCRICLSISVQPYSPLVTPCNCTGSIAYIHISCLQQWFSSKVIVKDQTESVICYGWKNIECELCKKQYTHVLKVDGKEYEIIQVKRPLDRPYLLIQQHERQNPKSLHLLVFNSAAPIRIGRGSDVDLRISDISVSRLHSSLIYENRQFWLTDNGSKFGTLIKIPNQIKLNAKCDGLQLQFNQTLIDFKILRRKKFCCFQLNTRATSKNTTPDSADTLQSVKEEHNENEFQDDQHELRKTIQSNHLNPATDHQVQHSEQRSLNNLDPDLLEDNRITMAHRPTRFMEEQKEDPIQEVSIEDDEEVAHVPELIPLVPSHDTSHKLDQQLIMDSFNDSAYQVFQDLGEEDDHQTETKK